MTTESLPAVRLYTRRWCGYCTAARYLLKHTSIDFDEIPLDNEPGLRRSIAQANGDWPTLPMIFIGDRFVGGYRELARLKKSGELNKIMEGAA